MVSTEVFEVSGLTVRVTQTNQEHAKIEFNGTIEGELSTDNHPGLFDFLINATSKDGKTIPNIEVYLEKVLISGEKANFTIDLIKQIQKGRESVVFYFKKSRRGRQIMFHDLIENAKELQIALYVKPLFIPPSKSATIT